MFYPMKTGTLGEAREGFDALFLKALNGETILIQEQNRCVALHACSSKEADFDVAPSGHFERDYSTEEIAELNTFASQSLQFALP
jgi:hypothetical protein